MIQFSFDWDSILNQGILALAVLLFPMQLWMLVFKGKPTFSGRFFLRLGLNILLWTAVLAFILQPYIKKVKVSDTGLVFGQDVPSSVRQKLTDSLTSVKVLNLSNLQDFENVTVMDTILLAG